MKLLVFIKINNTYFNPVQGTVKADNFEMIDDFFFFFQRKAELEENP